MGEGVIRIKCQNCGTYTIISIDPGASRAVACPACSARLVEDRVAELNAATAVPGPLAIEGVFPGSEPERHELAPSIFNVPRTGNSLSSPWASPRDR